jgi:hypothetical protein
LGRVGRGDSGALVSARRQERGERGGRRVAGGYPLAPLHGPARRASAGFAGARVRYRGPRGNWPREAARRGRYALSDGAACGCGREPARRSRVLCGAGGARWGERGAGLPGPLVRTLSVAAVVGVRRRHRRAGRLRCWSPHLTRIAVCLWCDRNLNQARRPTALEAAAPIAGVIVHSHV